MRILLEEVSIRAIWKKLHEEILPEKRSSQKEDSTCIYKSI